MSRDGLTGDLVRDACETSDQVAQEAFIKGGGFPHSDRCAQARLHLAGDRGPGCKVQALHPISPERQRDHRTAVHKIRNPARTLPEIVPLTFDTPMRRRCRTGTSTYRYPARSALTVISRDQP